MLQKEPCNYLDIINISICKLSTIIMDSPSIGRISSLFALSDIRCKLLNPLSKSYLYKYIYIPFLRNCMDMNLWILQNYFKHSDTLVENCNLPLKYVNLTCTSQSSTRVLLLRSRKLPLQISYLERLL